MASSARFAKLTASQVRAHPSRPRKRVATKPTAPLETPPSIPQDDWLSPRAGKFDFSERAEPPRNAAVSRAASAEDDEPTSWSKYDGLIAAKPARAKAQRSEVPKRATHEDDEDRYSWSKYERPVRPAAPALSAPVPQEPAGHEAIAETASAPTAAGSPDALPLPVPVAAAQSNDFSLLLVKPSFRHLYRAAWLDAQPRARAAALAALPLPAGAEAEKSWLPANLAAPAPLALWHAPSEQPRRAAIAFDPLLALTIPTEPSAEASGTPVSDPGPRPEVLVLTGPPPRVLASRRPAVPFHGDDSIGTLTNLAALRPPLEEPAELVAGGITLTLPRPLLLSTTETGPAHSLVPLFDPLRALVDPVEAAVTNEAPREKPLPASVAVSAIWTLSAAHPALPSEAMVGMADGRALAALRPRLEADIETAEPIVLALPSTAWLSGQGAERPSNAAIAPDPMSILAEPTLAAAETAIAPSALAAAEPVPELLTFAAFDAELSQDTGDDREAATALAGSRELAAWPSLPPLDAAFEPAPEADASLMALGAAGMLPAVWSDDETRSFDPAPAIEPLAMLAEPTEPGAEAEQSPAIAATQLEMPPVSLPNAAGEVAAGDVPASDNSLTVPDVAPLPGPETPPDLLPMPNVETGLAQEREAHAEPATGFAAEERAQETLSAPAQSGEAAIEPQPKRPASPPDRAAERRAAIAALTDQLSSVVGTVLESKEYAALPRHRSRGSSDPGLGARGTAGSRAAPKPRADGLAPSPRVVELPRRRADGGRGRGWARFAVAAAATGLVIGSGYFGLNLTASPLASAPPPVRTEVAAVAAPSPVEPPATLISNLQVANGFETSQVMQPRRPAEPKHTERRTHLKRPHRP